MIEFKAECGHTVRAKNEDADKVVRCAYCGKEARVPSSNDEDIDFLFADIGKESPDDSAKGRKRGSKPRATANRTGRSKQGLDPFGIITKMAYAAVIIIVVILVGKNLWPMFQEFYYDSQTTPIQVAKNDKTEKKPVAKKPSAPSKKDGLLNPRLDRRGKQGIYIASIPAVAEVYYRDGHGQPGELDWLNDPKTSRKTTPAMIDAKPGDYTVVVTLPINDKQLKKNYRNAKPEYDVFRAEVERETKPDKADDAVDKYFMPDSACAVKAIRVERITLAREYHITVRSNSWTVLTSLFLPDLSDMRQVASYLPRQDNYGFDEVDIRDELAFYKVLEEDQDFIVDILHRIGTISYRDEQHGGRYRLLRIDPQDGSFSAEYLRVPGRKRRDWKSGQ